MRKVMVDSGLWIVDSRGRNSGGKNGFSAEGAKNGGKGRKGLKGLKGQMGSKNRGGAWIAEYSVTEQKRNGPEGVEKKQGSPRSDHN